MNGTEKITEKILEDAHREADAAIAAAEAEAGTIAEAYRATVEKTMAEGRQAANKEKEERRSRAESAEKMEDRRAILEAKTAAMDEVYRAAEERLVSLKTEEKTAFYGKLLREAAESWLSGVRSAREAGDEVPDVPALEILVNDADLPAAGPLPALLGKELAGEKLPPVRVVGGGDFAGGFCLRAGDVEINCTLEMLLAEHRRTKEGAVFAVLFPA